MLQVNYLRKVTRYMHKYTLNKSSMQNKSTEGRSKLKRSVDMTRSGKNGLNIRTNANAKWDRTRYLEAEASSVGLPGNVVNILWKTSLNKVMTAKTVIRSNLVTRSRFR